MNIIGAVKAVFDTIANVFGFMRERSALKNSPEMKQADLNQKDAQAKDSTEKAIANRDIEKVRKDLSLLVVALWITGCTTVTPNPIKEGSIAWDGNVQNAGLLFINPDRSLTISAGARDRYNSLIERYGQRMTMKLKKDDGLTPVYIMGAQHAVDFATMNRWSKAEKP